MWKDLYPGTPVDSVPIRHITNGVHISGWSTATASTFWSSRLGFKWTDRIQDTAFWKKLLSSLSVSDEELWSLRTRLRRELVEYTRKRLRQQQLRLNPNDLGVFDSVLSPEALTIGFARRFATYKRAPLFFRDMEWAIRVLTSTERPVQIIYAGKAHPRDDAGKRFIQEIVNFTKRPELAGRVVFIEDYDIDVARHLVAGADVWLNNPRRPLEACGTSGMKAIMHGALHVSTMDGWWREAYDGHNGWRIGEDQSLPDENAQMDSDAASLRSVMERDIIPLFYARGKDNIPHRWLAKVRRSMATLIPVYNTHRMVMEYAAEFYAPAKKKSS
jgi:starch phosphorylase